MPEAPPSSGNLDSVFYNGELVTFPAFLLRRLRIAAVICLSSMRSTHELLAAEPLSIVFLRMSDPINLWVSSEVRSPFTWWFM